MAIIYCTELKSDEVEKPSISTQKPRCYTRGHLSRTKPKIKREQDLGEGWRGYMLKNKTKTKGNTMDLTVSLIIMLQTMKGKRSKYCFII